MRFARAIAPTPITLPSHASILTGQHPFHHGARNNGTHHLPAEATTLAERLGPARHAKLLEDLGLVEHAVDPELGRTARPHGTEARAGEKRDDGLGAVGQKGTDPIASLYAQPFQGPCQFLGQLLQFTVTGFPFQVRPPLSWFSAI